jgi:hypothetical protein
LRADDVILAMLRHDLDSGQPGLTQAEMLASPWWRAVEGEWSKNAGGAPAHTTISRACNRMGQVTDQQSAAGVEPLVATDGGSPARWRLQPAGFEHAGQMLTLLRSAGVLGPAERAQARSNGVDVARLEHEALLLAEQQQLLAEAARQAVSAQFGGN